MIRHYSRAVLHPRISLFFTSCTALASMSSTKETTTFYEFEANDIDGNLTSMSKYKVNRQELFAAASTISEIQRGWVTYCRFSMQSIWRPGLVYVYYVFLSFGLLIINYLKEPKSESEIKKFATERYGVTFDMYSKINVNGKDTHPLWVYLKSKQGGTFGSFIKWNFTKFLVDRTGNPVKRFGPKEDPDSMEKDIVALLNQSKEL
ncbi:glutathione peroxidase [Trichinella nativa]|uniref:Glutathione peroxidase n=1 Tax=Trichinella nativa TaxID=6335 RepID=A0A1Y3EKB3_9BILA|nr:glutathione peroxidase [Trichinella nativa]